MNDTTFKQELLALEQQRCAALMAGDIAALDALLAEDLIHIHGTGEVEGKQAYLHGVQHKYRFHDVQRGALLLRPYGDIVIVTGSLNQVISVNGADGRRAITAVVTQSWVRSGDRWHQNTCHVGFLTTI